METVQLSVEGTRMHGSFHPAANAHACAILLHGFHSSTVEMGDLPSALAAAGVHALAFDQRGFGASAGERGRTSLDRVLADVEAAEAWLRQRVGRLPLFVVGHSLGGAYALGVASRMRVAGVVTAHPVARLLDETTGAKALGYHIIGRINRRRLRKGKPTWMLPNPTRYKHLFVDNQVRAWARQNPFLQERLNVGNYDFAATMDAAAWAKRVKVPVLGIRSRHDEVVRPRSTDRVLDAVAGPLSRFEHRGGHSCFLDLDADRVTDRIIHWIKEHA